MGDFLRARREQIRPEDVGLVAGSRRRVAGLRREELATLAGISAAYYLRLEQGRLTNPSGQVVDALARALQLDARATRHLRLLAGASGSESSGAEAQAHGLANLVDQFLMPAILANRYQDVVAANPLAQLLSPEFHPGQNFLRWRLLDPAARELYVDWDEATDSVVRALRQLSGPCPDDARFQALIAELSDASPRFRELWGRASVGFRLGQRHMRHPLVGDIHLCRNLLYAPYPGGDHILVYHAERGSDSARALEELRSRAGSCGSELKEASDG